MKLESAVLISVSATGWGKACVRGPAWSDYLSDKLMENAAPLSRLLKQWGPSDMKTLAILLSLHAVCYTKQNPEIILISINRWNLRMEKWSKWKILERRPQVGIEISNNRRYCLCFLFWRTPVFKTIIVLRNLSTEDKISEEWLVIIGKMSNLLSFWGI